MINYIGTLLEITTCAVFSIMAVTAVIFFLFASVKVIKGLAKEV